MCCCVPCVCDISFFLTTPTLDSTTSPYHFIYDYPTLIDLLGPFVYCIHDPVDIYYCYQNMIMVMGMYAMRSCVACWILHVLCSYSDEMGCCVMWCLMSRSFDDVSVMWCFSDMMYHVLHNMFIVMFCSSYTCICVVSSELLCKRLDKTLATFLMLFRAKQNELYVVDLHHIT